MQGPSGHAHGPGPATLRRTNPGNRAAMLLELPFTHGIASRVPRHRALRHETVLDHATFEIREVSASEAPVAFVVETPNAMIRFPTARALDGRLLAEEREGKGDPEAFRDLAERRRDPDGVRRTLRALRGSVGVPRDVPPTLPSIVARDARLHGPGAVARVGDDRAEALARAARDYAGRLILVGGKLHMAYDDVEPTWRICWSGRMANGRLGLALGAGPVRNDEIAFRADRREAASRYLDAYADHRGLSKWSAAGHVEVHEPAALRDEVVHLARMVVRHMRRTLPSGIVVPWKPDPKWPSHVVAAADRLAAWMDRPIDAPDDAVAVMETASDFRALIPRTVPRSWPQAAEFLRQVSWTMEFWDRVERPRMRREANERVREESEALSAFMP